MVGRLMCVQAMREMYKAVLYADDKVAAKRIAPVATDNTAGQDPKE
jgi:hypothetical protein